MCWRSFRSSADRGSSSSSTEGSTASARAIATRWRWPPESSPGRLFSWPRARRARAAASARSRRWRLAIPRASSPKATFSHTLISGKSARFWKISAVGRLFGPMPAMSSPPMSTRPVVGSRKPEIIRRIVVLPQPDGPRIEKNSPARTVRSVGWTAVKSPNRIETPSSVTSLPRIKPTSMGPTLNAHPYRNVSLPDLSRQSMTTY